jgi:NADPH-dependent 2,4-dienoyl-CoA reductase/sulfur reductase-like enzyme/nitrite reductase/ring-hydroxylating ferredoxin subunit
MAATGKRDFTQGVAFSEVPDGHSVSGNVGEAEVILIRRGDNLFAVGAYCTHYHGALADGLVVGDTVRCPSHHACFDLRTGKALRAPALDPITCWRVERIGETAFVREKLTPPAVPRLAPSGLPRSVVIVGGGAAGLAAADTLRQEGYDGPVTLVSADDSPPVDRPNLSKDFLAGTAPDEWMPLRAPQYYAEQRIDLSLNSHVSAIDSAARRVTLEGGRQLEFGALLLATGADPVRLDIPGATPSQVCYLRTFSDSRAIVAKATTAKRVVVVGASFIGLEAAASLRTRGIDVHIAGSGTVPMQRVLGADVGRFVQSLHESHGVTFHLGATVARMDGRQVTLTDGTTIDADFLVVGVGVRPSISLATSAGLNVDRGVSVNEYLETSAPGIFAAGDIARWPDPHSGERIRVEHWVVAQRQGQVAARNILGQRAKYDAVPFFWSQHYDVSINYVGHAAKWDSTEMDGSLGALAAARNCRISYKAGPRTLAVATISRDLESLQAELDMERD